MLFPIKNRDDNEELEQLAALKNQVDQSRLQDRLGKQKFHEGIKQVFEPVTDTVKNTSEDFTKTMMETSFKNKKSISDINEKV